MEKDRELVNLRPIKGGYAALGNGWAVHGKTEEEAVRLYREAIERHQEIDSRPIPKSDEVAIVE